MASGPRRAVVYGLSNEGYRLAARVARAGLTVSIVDEILQVATRLEPRLLEAFRNAASFAREEALLSVVPLDEAIGAADLVVVAPRLRGSPEEAKSEVSAHFKGFAKTLKKGVCVLSVLPAGLGDGETNAALIEMVSGLEAGTGFVYGYAPREGFVGCHPAKPEKEQGNLLKAAGAPPSAQSLKAAEAHYASTAIAELASAAAELEAYKLSQAMAPIARPKKTLFIDDIAASFFDSKLISPTMEPATALFQLAAGGIKSVSAYPRHLAERLKQEAKLAGWRMSQLRVVLAWEVDSYEARPERRRLREEVETRLRDLVDEVVLLDQQRSRALWPEERPTLAVACSALDYKHTLSLQPVKSILRADMACSLYAKR